MGTYPTIDHCPTCGERFEVHTDVVNGALPSEGQPAICAFCAAVNTFGPDLKLRSATTRELLAFMRSREFVVVLGAVEARLGIV